MARSVSRRNGRFATAGRLCLFTFLALAALSGTAWAQTGGGQNSVLQTINTITRFLYRGVGPGVLLIGLAQTAFRYALAGSQEGGRGLSGWIMAGVLLSCGGWLVNTIMTGTF